MMNTTEFNNELRKAVASLATGEMPQLLVSDFNIQSNLSEEDARKITPSYLRTICNRVPEVKKVGCVSIKRNDLNPDLPSGFLITMVNKEHVKKPRVMTKEEVRQMKSKAAAEELRYAATLTPIMTDLEGDKLIGATEAVNRYRQMLITMASRLEEDE